MELFPAIDLRAGRCVRLRQGDYAHETVYHDDPTEVARAFAAAGVRWIHVVDLDAARDGGAANLDAIARVCAAVPQIRVQTGGGIRTLEAAQARLDAGAARVVVGSAAVERPELVEQIAVRHEGAAVVGLDVRGREVAVHGWTEGSGLTIEELLPRFAQAGAAALVVTQIAVDGMLSGPDLDLYREVLVASALPLIASGGVGSLDDLRALAALQVGERTVAGAIAGKAIYEGRFGVAEGVQACSPPV